MPKSGTGLGIAKGIELGAQNFLQSFFAVKQFKEQQKYRKMQPVIDVVKSQIADPNLPLDQKIKAMDTLPLLLGAKADVPLSQMLGLDKLAQQEVETGEETIQQGTKGGLVEDQGAVEFNKKSLRSGTELGIYNEEGLVSTDSTLATSVEQKPTKTLRKKSLKRRGELSATDLAIAKQVQINRAEQEDQFQRQYKLAQVQADLQYKTLAQQGWKNNGDWTYNNDSNSWTQEWFNPITKETYQQNLQPGVVPESVILKQIQSGGKGSGVSLAYKTLREAIATSMGREVDDPEVNLRTANLWKDNFSSLVTGRTQDITGTRPIQPSQKEGLSLQRLQAQQTHANLVAQASSSLENVNSLAARKGQAWQISADTKATFDKIKEDYDPEDKEYLDAQAAFNKALDDANRIESEYQTALRSHNSLSEQVKISERNLGNIGIGTSSSGQNQQFSPQMRAAIAAVRKANPNTKLTDEQIAERIKADPKYSHIR